MLAKILKTKYRYLLSVIVLEGLIDIVILGIELDNTKKITYLLINFIFFTLIVIYILKDIFKLRNKKNH